MSDLDNTTDELQQDELASLKQRADMLGIKYHPSIGVEALREKVRGKLDESLPASADKVVTPKQAEASGTAGEETEGQRRKRMKDEASKLIRIRVTCMNQAKKEWHGEIFTVGNSVVGTHRKFVPFDAEEGYHVPYIIYLQMKDRQCQTFINEKSKNGVTVRRPKLIKEFAIEVLDPLTPQELKELAQRQAMASGTQA